MTKEKFDAIIIGSGIGGLSCAASLALCNYKVLVLEKNLSPGGSMGSFTEPETGNWTWSPGVQWVCDYSETSVDHMLIKAITNGKASFTPLDYECQIKYFPDLNYQFVFINDKSELLKKLKSEFPHESKKMKKSQGCSRFQKCIRPELPKLCSEYPGHLMYCLIWINL